MSDEPTETKTTAAERRQEEAQQRQALIRKASADLHGAVGGMLNQGLSWSEITRILEAAAAGAKQQQALEKA